MTEVITETQEPPAYRWRWLALAAVLAAEIMDLIDGTVVGIAAPSIRADLGGGDTMIQWVAAGYTLAFAVGLITGGRLGDLYGRRRMFLVGLVGFVAASVLCGLATTPATLIGARVAQGLLGAVLIPQGFGVIKTIFPPRELGKAFGAFGPTIGLAVVGAPILGGALIDWDLAGTGWRTVFLINVPIGLAALALAVAALPESRADDGPRPDPIGVVLVSTGLALLVFPLVQGRELGWPTWIRILPVVAVAVLALFAVHQVRRRNAGRAPLVEPALFRLRAFSAGMGVGLAFFAGMTGMILALGLYLQLGLGYTPLQAGLTQAPWALGVAIGSALSGAVLAARFGRSGLQVGALVMVAGIGVVVLTIALAEGTVTGWQLAPGTAGVRVRHGHGDDAVLRHHPGRRHPAAGRLGVRGAQRQPAVGWGRGHRGAGHGVLRPLRRGERHRRDRRRARGVGRAGAGRGRPRLPAAPAQRRSALNHQKPVVASQRSHTAASPIVSTLSDGRRRSTASSRSPAVPRTATSPLPWPCSHVMPPPAAADQPLPRRAQAVVGGVQVQGGPVGEGRVGLVGLPRREQAEPLRDAPGGPLGVHREVGRRGRARRRRGAPAPRPAAGGSTRTRAGGR